MSAALTFHHTGIFFQVSETLPTPPADLLNPLRYKRTFSRATLNVTLLALKPCLFPVPDTQPDNSAETRRCVGIAVGFFFRSSGLYKNILVRGQCGLAASNPISSRTMPTKSTDTSCRRALSRGTRSALDPSVMGRAERRG